MTGEGRAGAPGAGERPPLRLVVVLALLGMFGPFSIDTAFPAFAAMGEELRSSPAAMQQVISTYLLAFAVMSLFHGPISDAVGRRPVMILGCLGYVVASIGCALSPDLTVLLAFRVLQGVTAGAGSIVARAVVRDLYDGPVAQRLMSAIAMVFGLAPAIAPVVGGWLLLVGTWRFIFWFLCGYGVLVALLVAWLLPESHPVERRRPFRPRPLLADIVMIARSLTFQRLSAASSACFGALFLWISSTPMLLPSLGFGEQDFGVLFIPMIGAMVLGSFVNNRLAMTSSTSTLVSVGQSVALVGSLVGTLLAFVPATTGHLPWLVLGPVALGFGTGLAYPIYQLALLDLFPSTRGAAASSSTLLTLLLNALISGVLASLVGHDVRLVAVTSLALLVTGILLWRWHRVVERRLLSSAPLRLPLPSEGL